MIRHCVYLSLADGHDPAELADVMAGLDALCADLDGASGFLHGPNADFELKSQAYPHGFTIDFTDAAALQRYADNPTHKALGGRLVALCAGGADGIMVYDLEAG